MEAIKDMAGSRRIRYLLRSRAFIVGFQVTYFLHFLLTAGVFELFSGGTLFSTTYGFPFTYYASGCYGGNYYVPGLLGNILFAAVLGTIIGVFCAYVWKTLASEDFRKRWNL